MRSDVAFALKASQLIVVPTAESESLTEESTTGLVQKTNVILT